MSLEVVLSDDEKEYVLNELVREQRKRALCEFYERHGRTDVLWGLVYLDINLLYRLVDKKADARDSPLFSQENKTTLYVLFRYNSELFQGVVGKRRRKLADLFTMSLEEKDLGMIQFPSESTYRDCILNEERDLEKIVADLNDTKDTQKSVDDLFPDYEKALDPTLRELATSDPSQFIELLYRALNQEAFPGYENLGILVVTARDFFGGPSLASMHDALPYLAKLTATQDKLPYKPNDATRFFEAYLNSPSICRERSKEDILKELRSLVNKEKEIDYVAFQKSVALNEVSSLAELLECAAIESPYQVVCKLGEGKSGRTYKVYSSHLKKHRALKIIDDPNPKEAELMARLGGESLDNVVQIHEAGTHIAKVAGEERYAIVMEYVEGKTLDELLLSQLQNDYRIIRPGFLDIAHDNAIPYGAQILNGIIHLRELGITHRDLHLRNIKATPRKRVKILDFGIATDEEHPQPKDNRRYGSPQSREADDVFSLGLIVYKLYTYKHLVLAKRRGMGASSYANAIAEMKETMHDERGKLKRSYVRKIPKPIRRIVVACLEGQSTDLIKREFLDVDPSIEYYFMSKDELIDSFISWRVRE